MAYTSNIVGKSALPWKLASGWVMRSGLTEKLVEYCNPINLVLPDQSAALVKIESVWELRKFKILKENQEIHMFTLVQSDVLWLLLKCFYL